jgi:hypothetical protein
MASRRVSVAVSFDDAIGRTRRARSRVGWQSPVECASFEYWRARKGSASSNLAPTANTTGLMNS